MRTLLAAAVAAALLLPAHAAGSVRPERIAPNAAADAVSVADYAPALFRFERDRHDANEATFAIVRATFGPIPLSGGQEPKIRFRHVKAFVCVDACRGDAHNLDTPIAPLEFQPVAEADGRVSFRAFTLLANGEASAHRAVRARTEAGELSLFTDGQGRVTLPADVVGPVSLIADMKRPDALTEDVAVASFTLGSAPALRAAQ